MWSIGLIALEIPISFELTIEMVKRRKQIYSVIYMFYIEELSLLSFVFDWLVWKFCSNPKNENFMTNCFFSLKYHLPFYLLVTTLGGVQPNAWNFDWVGAHWWWKYSGFIKMIQNGVPPPNMIFEMKFTFWAVSRGFSKTEWGFHNYHFLIRVLIYK